MRENYPPVLEGLIKQAPEHFFVDEVLPFEPGSDEGEFALVRIEKRLAHTTDVAAALAAHCKRPLRDVEFAGRKDYFAVARQWFCVHLPGLPTPDLTAFNSERWRVIEHTRHTRKLRRGALRGNSFRITVSAAVFDPDQFNQRVELIRANGVPNYFGSQRFGKNDSNLRQAMDLSQGKRLRRDRRSMALSAARALLFNDLLERRVADDSWTQPAATGEAWMFADGTRCFAAPSDSETLARFHAGEIDLTGPLWGEGESLADASVAELEAVVAAEHPELSQLLVDARLKQERRRLCLRPEDFEYRHDGSDLCLSFRLERGAFATSILDGFGPLSEQREQK